MGTIPLIFLIFLILLLIGARYLNGLTATAGAIIQRNRPAFNRHLELEPLRMP
jgi:hypothetical protein